MKIAKVVLGFKTLYMSSEGLGEMFDGFSADMCAGKFPLLTRGGADPGARTAIGASGIVKPSCAIFKCFLKYLDS